MSMASVISIMLTDRVKIREVPIQTLIMQPCQKEFAYSRSQNQIHHYQ